VTFPQTAFDDRTRLVVDGTARGELFFKPQPWIQMAGGLEINGNSHDQVDNNWHLDLSDRDIRRPPLSVRTLNATITHGAFTLDAGKQFIRWGKTDFVVPTDRFSPRDYITVVDAPYIAVSGLRGTAQIGTHSIEVVWVPRFTPSRVPLVDQRWAVRPLSLPADVPIVEIPPIFPDRSQVGVRFAQTADRLDYSVSFYDGFNHLPDIQANVALSGAVEYERIFSRIRAYGADTAIPLRWLSVKAEAAYITSASATTDEYVLYAIQFERQTGEWVFIGGYAGETVTDRRALLTFAPDRELARSIVGRATYTIDANRSVEVEGAVRQNGAGVYAKAEYSRASGQHWRTTIGGVLLAGEADDFFGQYRRNSHVRVTVRYNF
jgi:hypothetical protein